MTTFKDLDAPFPLFEAPITDADGVLIPGFCSLCGKDAEVCFELGIGCAVMLACSQCGAVNGLDASDRKSVACRQCQQIVAFPPFPPAEGIACCYSCLRAGLAAITKDTEIGMVSWEQAFEGMTHGRPGLSHPDFELVSTDSDWVRARLPQNVMFELLRTPTYQTIQGDSWLFCCKQPMVFIGQWDRAEFSKHASDGDGQAFFRSIVRDIVPGLWEDKLHDQTGIYVFRCHECTRMSAHWDLA